MVTDVIMSTKHNDIIHTVYSTYNIQHNQIQIHSGNSRNYSTCSSIRKVIFKLHVLISSCWGLLVSLWTCSHSWSVDADMKYLERKGQVNSSHLLHGMILKSLNSATLNKSTLRCVTPLGRPKSVFKSDVECRFLEFWIEIVKWIWRSRSMILIFNTSRENPKMLIWY